MYVAGRYAQLRQNDNFNRRKTIRLAFQNMNLVDFLIIFIFILCQFYFITVFVGSGEWSLYTTLFLHFMLKPIVRWLYSYQLWSLERSVPSDTPNFLANVIFLSSSLVLFVTPIWYFCIVFEVFPQVYFLGSLVSFYTFLCFSSLVTYMLVSGRLIYFILNIQGKLERMMATMTRSNSSNQTMDGLKRTINVSGFTCTVGCLSTAVALAYHEYIKVTRNLTSEPDREQDIGFRYIQDLDLFLNVIGPATPVVYGYILSLSKLLPKQNKAPSTPVPPADIYIESDSARSERNY